MAHLRLTLPTGTLGDPHKHALARGIIANARSKKSQFDFPVIGAGQTKDSRVFLYIEPSTGQQGLAVANAILPQLNDLMASNDANFGIKTNRGGNVILAALQGATDGSTGAYHYGCDFATGGDWYADLAFGEPDLTLGLVQAEITESYMGLQNKGWGCGDSNGEALSRFLAEMASGGSMGALYDYTTAPSWAKAGFPNWIDATEPTDGDPISIGCGMVYLYWLVSRGFAVSQIVQAGCPRGTLASNYSILGQGQNAWGDFMAAVKGLPVITSDNPWPVSPPPLPTATGGTLTAQDIADLISAQATLTRILAEQKS